MGSQLPHCVVRDADASAAAKCQSLQSVAGLCWVGQPSLVVCVTYLSLATQTTSPITTAHGQLVAVRALERHPSTR